MAGLYQILNEQGYKTAAIVGMTKNVGKTVTLNNLVKEFEKNGKPIGLISAGYDGERVDRLTLKDKPRIYAPVNAIVATAEACFKVAEARLEYLEAGSMSTPLGEVYLARVLEPGLVELAGPASVSGLKGLIYRMYNYGSENVLVDGAINRIASASPDVSENTILASGASLGPTMDDVIKKTIFRCELFQTPEVEDENLLKEALSGLQDGLAVHLYTCSTGYKSDSVSAAIPMQAGAQVIGKCDNNTAALVFGGAFIDGLIEELINHFDTPPMVIVRDATKLFISPENYYRFRNRGGEVRVLKRINLVAVTLNPTDPGGRGYDPRMFLEKMREALQPIPVFDLVYESA